MALVSPILKYIILILLYLVAPSVAKKSKETSKSKESGDPVTTTVTVPITTTPIIPSMTKTAAAATTTATVTVSTIKDAVTTAAPTTTPTTMSGTTEIKEMTTTTTITATDTTKTAINVSKEKGSPFQEAFFQCIPNSKMVGGLIRSTKVKSVSRCAILCAGLAECSSFNVKKLAPLSVLCELIGQGNQIETLAGYKHYKKGI